MTLIDATEVSPLHLRGQLVRLEQALIMEWEVLWTTPDGPEWVDADRYIQRRNDPLEIVEARPPGGLGGERP